jgi:hypothetical protein
MKFWKVQGGQLPHLNSYGFAMSVLGEFEFRCFGALRTGHAVTPAHFLRLQD